jgi:hypothetical protein
VDSISIVQDNAEKIKAIFGILQDNDRFGEGRR